jgi:hypothetical protein
MVIDALLEIDYLPGLEMGSVDAYGEMGSQRMNYSVVVVVVVVVVQKYSLTQQTCRRSAAFNWPAMH